jgi:hypothetical protein
MLKRFLVAAALTGIGVAAAQAACTPFGGDDTGCLTADKSKSTCEQKVLKNVVKAVAGTIKCQKKQADSAFKNASFDEEACETAVLTKFTGTTDTTNCSCVNTATIAATIESTVDGNNNKIYCDPAGTPFGGDDTGNVASTKTILVCEDKLGKCVSLLAKGYGLCHQHAAQDFVHGTAFDEEACEETNPTGPVNAFNKCVASLQGCQGCEDTSGLRSLLDSSFDTGNVLVFCESPSGAFVAN